MTFKDCRNESLSLAVKFGFVPKKIVWDFLTPRSRAAKFKYWGLLLQSPLLKPYVIGKQRAEHLILSQSGRSVFEGQAVSPSNQIYLEHDELVMRFYLAIKKIAIEGSLWTESELRSDKIMAIKTLGDSQGNKIPDLTFDIQKEEKIIRYALEIERSRKTISRYKAIRRAYERAWKVDAIIFGVSSDSIMKALKSEFDQAHDLLDQKQVVYFDFNCFGKNGLNTSLLSPNDRKTFLDFFKIDLSLWKRAVDNSWTGVHGKLGTENE